MGRFAMIVNIVGFTLGILLFVLGIVIITGNLSFGSTTASCGTQNLDRCANSYVSSGGLAADVAGGTASMVQKVVGGSIVFTGIGVTATQIALLIKRRNTKKKRGITLND
jgi:hypothetical protein